MKDITDIKARVISERTEEDYITGRDGNDYGRMYYNKRAVILIEGTDVDLNLTDSFIYKGMTCFIISKQSNLTTINEGNMYGKCNMVSYNYELKGFMPVN